MGDALRARLPITDVSALGRGCLRRKALQAINQWCRGYYGGHNGIFRVVFGLF
jgi:hypothetical protein